MVEKELSTRTLVSKFRDRETERQNHHRDPEKLQEVIERCHSALLRG